MSIQAHGVTPLGLEAHPLWYVGPESGTYHTSNKCPALTRSRRYWGLDKALSVDALPRSDHYSNRGHPRRLCKLCAKEAS